MEHFPIAVATCTYTLLFHVMYIYMYMYMLVCMLYCDLLHFVVKIRCVYNKMYIHHVCEINLVLQIDQITVTEIVHTVHVDIHVHNYVHVHVALVQFSQYLYGDGDDHSIPQENSDHMVTQGVKSCPSLLSEKVT